MKEIDKKGASLMDKRIESIQNPKVKEWKKLQTKKGRMQYRQFFIEGEHLIEEAIKHQSRVDVLLAVENTDVPVKWLEQITQMYWVTPVVMKYLSQIETSQGIAAICSMPVYDLELKNGCSYLLVDRVQDPGNFGTLIRTAEAIGVQAVLYTKGTVDVYNDKVFISRFWKWMVWSAFIVVKKKEFRYMVLLCKMLCIIKKLHRQMNLC